MRLHRDTYGMIIFWCVATAVLCLGQVLFSLGTLFICIRLFDETGENSFTRTSQKRNRLSVPSHKLIFQIRITQPFLLIFDSLPLQLSVQYSN